MINLQEISNCQGYCRTKIMNIKTIRIGSFFVKNSLKISVLEHTRFSIVRKSCCINNIFDNYFLGATYLYNYFGGFRT